MNIVYIIWLRQIKRYFRARARIIGSLAQPLLFLLALGFGFGPIFQKAGEGNYIQFIVPGIIAMSILFTSIFSGIEVIWDKQFGFLKETLVAPVSRTLIMIGRTLGSATVAALQGIIVLAISFALGFRVTNLALLPVSIIFMFLISLFFTSVGTAIGSMLDDMQGFQLIMNFVVMPLFFLSGALFPLDKVPKVLNIVAAADPLTYGVDGLRGTLIGMSSYGLTIDLLVLGGLTVVFVVIGSYLFSRIQI